METDTDRAVHDAVDQDEALSVSPTNQDATPETFHLDTLKQAGLEHGKHEVDDTITTHRHAQGSEIHSAETECDMQIGEDQDCKGQILEVKEGGDVSQKELLANNLISDSQLEQGGQSLSQPQTPEQQDERVTDVKETDQDLNLKAEHKPLEPQDENVADLKEPLQVSVEPKTPEQQDECNSDVKETDQGVNFEQVSGGHKPPEPQDKSIADEEDMEWLNTEHEPPETQDKSIADEEDTERLNTENEPPETQDKSIADEDTEHEPPETQDKSIADNEDKEQLNTENKPLEQQDVSLESVSGDESELVPPETAVVGAENNAYTVIQSPEGNSSGRQYEDQGGQAESNDYTDIQSPESISLSNKASDDRTDRIAADTQSPESHPVGGQAGLTGDYTEIQSPEARSLFAEPYDDDREDISDGELDLTTENTALSAGLATDASEASASKHNIGGSGGGGLEARSSAAGDGQNVKVDDTGKSDAGSIADDASRVSKGPSEDLEAVSEDELPDASHTKTTAIPLSKAVVQGGEDVSSDDEPSENSAGNMSRKSNEEKVGENLTGETSATSVMPIQHEPVSPTALPDPESPVGLAEPVSPTALPEEEPLAEPVSPTALAEPVSPTALPELAPLDAEPISEEEDNSGLAEDEDGEAGEIKSPTEDITSPPSSPDEGAAADLGEVEPVSADDTNDTDGELPSGDDDDSTKPGADHFKDGTAKFESIESDDEGDLGGFSVGMKKTVPAKATDGKPDGYMESISDEETIDNSNEKVAGSSAVITSTGSVETNTLEAKDAGELGKKIPAPNFNEHQVELDYEEAEGDDGEVKAEENRLEHNKSEQEQEGRLPNAPVSDKDEGELSDDDCEEGEIKEPGSRKPFIKPMCRFFQRGHCTWGVNCRFLHPGVNDKGNYQMIEIPGFQPTGVHARLGGPGPWAEQAAPVEPVELPPPPLPDTPPPETAWERGLRIAKEQRKKATERKEQEPDFEEKRLNLSVDEERELNKENERVPRIIPKDPYYDQQAYEEDEYYKIQRDPWHTGHYENFEVPYNREPSYSPPPPYREKPLMPAPPMRYGRPYNSPPQPPPPPVDKFGRDRIERREEYRQKPAPPPPPTNDYPSPPRRPDEWVDPWRRQTTRKSSKSPARGKHKRSHSRGRRGRRSVSDSSNSSRSGSGSSTGSSRSSRSYSGSSGSSSRSRSPEPAPPGVERHERYPSPSRDQPRSAVSVRGRGGGGYHAGGYDSGYRGRDQPGYGRSMRGGGGGARGGYRGRGGSGAGGPPYMNNYGGGQGRAGDVYPGRDNRDVRDRGRLRAQSPPDRPLPYVRPRPRSASSRSSSSGSRSRSRSRAGRDGGRGRGSSSRSSSGSSSSRSSSSSSAASADSEHLYRDLGSPGKSPAHARTAGNSKKKRVSAAGSHKERGLGGASRGVSQAAPPMSGGGQRHPGLPASQAPGSQHQQRHPVNLDHIPIPRESRDSRGSQREARDPRDTTRDNSRLASGGGSGQNAASSGQRLESSRYSSRNAPQAPVKAKDPLKVVGQKSNIKLTLLPKVSTSSMSQLLHWGGMSLPV
ncbi:zinc finger CCCH domain-containing protein 18-like [Elysia marginata]|uniref:Zinc finger CCCH domain-containing protein 18-like n=1 Tax=Elysia marginata TaxID=1093978 RepID=A0AAV4FS27_9GAST|nr:zinc finger CCCH domain-containing protein 18-like [Elysia marginata]